MPVPIDFIIKSLNDSNTIKSRSNPKFPCGVCRKNVNYNNPSKQCTHCLYWIHVKCTDMSVQDHSNQLCQKQTDVTESEHWTCPKCTLLNNAEMFPFGLLSNDYINNMNSSNSMHKLEMIPEFEITSQITKINEICSNDIDDNIPNNVNCKYFTNEEFSSLPKTKNSFNLFHANVNGIENHFEDLETVIVDSNLNFSAICISETSQRESTMFCKNIDLKHYHKPISTGTKTAKGGIAIYVLKDHDSLERYDLKTCNVEYESTWVEIKNKKSKNIIIGCIYRHPHYNNLEEFTQYMTNTLFKLNKENKEIYICGDFNIPSEI